MTGHLHRRDCRGTSGDSAAKASTSSSFHRLVRLVRCKIRSTKPSVGLQSPRIGRFSVCKETCRPYWIVSDRQSRYRARTKCSRRGFDAHLHLMIWPILYQSHLLQDSSVTWRIADKPWRCLLCSPPLSTWMVRLHPGFHERRRSDSIHATILLKLFWTTSVGHASGDLETANE